MLRSVASLWRDRLFLHRVSTAEASKWVLDIVSVGGQSGGIGIVSSAARNQFISHPKPWPFWTASSGLQTQLLLARRYSILYGVAQLYPMKR